MTTSTNNNVGSIPASNAGSYVLPSNNAYWLLQAFSQIIDYDSEMQKLATEYQQKYADVMMGDGKDKKGFIQSWSEFNINSAEESKQAMIKEAIGLGIAAGLSGVGLLAGGGSALYNRYTGGAAAEANLTKANDMHGMLKVGPQGKADIVVENLVPQEELAAKNALKSANIEALDKQAARDALEHLSPEEHAKALESFEAEIARRQNRVDGFDRQHNSRMQLVNTGSTTGSNGGQAIAKGYAADDSAEAGKDKAYGEVEQNAISMMNDNNSKWANNSQSHREAMLSTAQGLAQALQATAGRV